MEDYKNKIKWQLIRIYICILLIGLNNLLINKQINILDDQISIIKEQNIELSTELVEVREDLSNIIFSYNSLTLVEEVEEVKQVKAVVEIPQSEFDLVCGVVNSEARGEGDIGIMAVAEVIKNRSQNWGMSLTEVVTASGQFASPNLSYSEELSLAVEEVLYYGTTVFPENTSPTHFFSGYTPYWVEEKEFVSEIGNHKFYQ